MYGIMLKHPMMAGCVKYFEVDMLTDREHRQVSTNITEIRTVGDQVKLNSLSGWYNYHRTCTVCVVYGPRDSVILTAADIQNASMYDVFHANTFADWIIKALNRHFDDVENRMAESYDSIRNELESSK